MCDTSEENKLPEEQAGRMDQPEEAACQEEATKPEKEEKEGRRLGKKAALQERVDQLEQQMAELDDRYKRMLAEYENFRKRSQKERETVYSDALSAAVHSFLPVLDNLQRAETQPCADDEYKKGMSLIVKQFSEILEKHGVKPTGAKGETFDPSLHNAVMHVEDESLGESEISEVLLPGYTMGERVIRHAMVKVAN